MEDQTVNMQHTSDAQHGKYVYSETNNHRATDGSDTVEVERTDKVTRSRNPLSAILDQPELFVSVLSYLPKRDLARAQRVSKHWSQTILNFAELRRILWQEPTKTTRIYLAWEDPTTGRAPFFTREASEDTRLIVEGHPALVTWMCGEEVEFTYFIKIALPLADELKTVPASTLLFQPPLESITMNCRYSHWTQILKRSGGLTFGDVVEAFERAPVRMEYPWEDHPAFDPACPEDVFLYSEEAVLNDSLDVVCVQEALSRLDNTQS
ncbi:hypothetical protein E2P81_ATG10480 [Venturia nashicola]|nr:hypothetical protein E2P81_ATG10480 [Venturia nashicola]